MSVLSLTPEKRLRIRLGCTIAQAAMWIMVGMSSLATAVAVVWVSATYVANSERDLKYARETAEAAQVTASEAVQASRQTNERLNNIQGDLRELTGKVDQFVYFKEK